MNRDFHKKYTYLIVPLLFLASIFMLYDLILPANETENRGAYTNQNFNEVHKDALIEKENSEDIFSVTLAGDYGANMNTEGVLSLVNLIKPDFHIFLGDLSYEETSSEESWCNFVKKNMGEVSSSIVPGNHESNGKDGHINNFIKCLPYSIGSKYFGDYPKDYYFDFPESIPKARFVNISPDLDFDNDKEVDYINNKRRSNWLINSIREAHKKGLWVVVSMHKPCLSTEKKSCEIGYDLPNLLIKEKVDIVFSGHAHLYDRTFQLSCVKSYFDPACVSSKEDSNLKRGNGTVFVTVGTGGVELRDIKPHKDTSQYFKVSFGKNNANVYGVSKLSVGLESLRVSFLSALSNNTMDDFIINK